MSRAVLLLGTVGVFAAGVLAGRGHHPRPATDAGRSSGRTILYYVDPMHPAYTSDAPGAAPDCGMALVPVYAEGPEHVRAVGTQTSTAAGAIRVTPDMQQMFGVRVAPVERVAAAGRLHAYGRVAADETRSYRIDVGASGYLRELSGVTTGSQVRKDQWLATVSAPELRSPIQGYIVALDILERSKAAGENAAQVAAAAAALELSAERLLTFGLSRQQLAEIARTKRVPPTTRITAPADGFVVARNVAVGQTLDRGHELYRIANLDRVWILADVFGPEAALVRPGMPATVRIPGRREALDARVSREVLPQFDAATQSVRLRLEAGNPGYVLRPDMFVAVELPVSLPDTIMVPVDAVRDAGREQTVFVERGRGVFEARRVEVGWRGGGRVEIVDGLTAGERIAVSGTFLLDSETRLRRRP
jgi:membrane fusion protein, copper/silver efflux system